MVIRLFPENCDFDFQKFNQTHNFLLLSKHIKGLNSVECVLIADGKLKEHFIIYKDEKGFHRNNLFYAKEYCSEEKSITSGFVKEFEVILEVINEIFFFTFRYEGRHFEQIAEMLWKKYGLK